MWSCTAAYDENWSGHRTADNWRKALLESYYKGIGNTYYTRIPRPMRAYKKTATLYAALYFGGTRSVYDKRGLAVELRAAAARGRHRNRKRF